ncbi:MAG: hypothetical protein EOM28_03550 [Clostridia bacterium]|nr:hypothetical protein [Clostridia bacterium]
MDVLIKQAFLCLFFEKDISCGGLVYKKSPLFQRGRKVEKMGYKIFLRFTGTEYDSFKIAEQSFFIS